MFSEDMVQVHYREELGLLANRRAEDLGQLDMLSSTNVMYVGKGELDILYITGEFKIRRNG